METEFITVNNVPVRVVSWGGHLPSKILEKPETKPKELLLVIPGNPGITKFYEYFLNELYEKTKKPIWIVSHGGHDQVHKKYPRLKSNTKLYNLQGQIDQKKQIIETYLQGVKLYCVGHSIGCKMILDILKDSDATTEIEKCYFLFPTIERMAETRNGSVVQFVIRYILWLTLLGSWIFVYLPRIIQTMLLRGYCLVTGLPPSNIPAIRELIEPHVLNKVFFLAHDEMKTVKELDDDTLKKHGDKLVLYYGATDGWTPLKYYEELKEKHENVKAQVCDKGYEHAFVLKHSKGVADLVTEWLVNN